MKLALCTVDGCNRRAFRTGLCHGHYHRKRYGLPIDGPIRAWGQPGWALKEAAIAYTEADPSDDAAYERAKARLRMAAARASTPRRPRRH